jgi:hypothetical protein
MEGSGQATMDGKTAIERTLGSPRNARPRWTPANIDEPTEALRVRLIAAVVETLAQGSHHRLGKTAHARTAA